MRVLIETRMNSLRLNESKQPKKGCLGRLEGVCADFKNPTRNGRLYPLELWKKVFADSLFKESLENKTLFGELDHPEERFEPLMTEACIVMTDYEIDEDKGLIYGGFDILDTPKGRILKSILDYGSVVGVSSRGQGDIVESADGERVDEDTYEFACFDVVSTPAVEKARQTVAESIKRVKAESFKESTLREINEAATAADLNIIRSVVRSSNVSESDMDFLIESIEDKCKSLQEAGNTIPAEESGNDKSPITESVQKTESANTIRDKKKLYRCIREMRERITAYKHREQRYVESMHSKDDEISKLSKRVKRLEGLQRKQATEAINVEQSMQTQQERLSQLQSHNRRLSENLKSKTTSIHEAEQRYDEVLAETEQLKETLRTAKASKSKLEEKLSQSRERIKQLENRIVTLSESHREDINSMDAEIASCNEQLEEAVSRIDENELTIQRLTESERGAQRKLSECMDRNKALTERITKYQESYLRKVAKANGINPDDIIDSVKGIVSPTKIDELVESMRSKIDKHNKAGLLNEGLQSDGFILESISGRPKDDSYSEEQRLTGFLEMVSNTQK